MNVTADALPLMGRELAADDGTTCSPAGDHADSGTFDTALVLVRNMLSHLMKMSDPTMLGPGQAGGHCRGVVLAMALA